MPAPNSATDRELVERANRGEARAFELLYERYREWIVAVAYRTAGDREIALEVLQDTIAYWLMKFPGFVLFGQVKSFLYPVVRHLAIDAARKRRRMAALSSEFDRAADSPSSVGGASTLHDALERLPAGQREVLLLHFGDGLTLADVATSLEIPIGTVKSRLSLALAALREHPRLRDEFEL